uniref:Uncharacterized protein n=1 Tax=Oryza meridionalis TaxID=40149 RepID=A0A0E0EWX3_9ORYZ
MMVVVHDRLVSILLEVWQTEYVFFINPANGNGMSESLFEMMNAFHDICRKDIKFKTSHYYLNVCSTNY